MPPPTRATRIVDLSPFMGLPEGESGGATAPAYLAYGGLNFSGTLAPSDGPPGDGAPDGGPSSGAPEAPEGAVVGRSPSDALWDGTGTPLTDPRLGWIQRPVGPECETIKWMWCPGCQEAKKVPLSCDVPTCPRCHYKWAAGESYVMVHQLWWARHEGVRGRIWECIVSPPRGAVGEAPGDVDAMIRRAYAIAREHGMSGGAAVVHYEMEESPGEYRPHAHLLGFVNGRWRPGPSSEGWLVKFVRVGGTRDDVRDKAFYEVSHCIRARGRQAVRWWGSCARNRIKKPSDDDVRAMGFEPRTTECRCPDCGAILEPMDVMDYTSWPPERVEFHCGEPPPDAGDRYEWDGGY